MKKSIPYEYPKGLEKNIKLKDGTKIFLRPIKPSDIDLWVELYRSLGSNTKYLRFFSNRPEPDQKMIEQYIKVDYINKFAIVAIIADNGKEKMIGVVRYGLDPPPENAELAVVVADKWQGKGLGTQMLIYMLQIMIKRKIKKVHGDVFLQNEKMLKIMYNSGFNLIKEDSYGVRHFEFKLQ